MDQGLPVGVTYNIAPGDLFFSQCAGQLLQWRPSFVADQVSARSFHVPSPILTVPPAAHLTVPFEGGHLTPRKMRACGTLTQTCLRQRYELLRQDPFRNCGQLLMLDAGLGHGLYPLM